MRFSDVDLMAVAAVKIQIINEAVGLRLSCTAAELADGFCVASTGEQMWVLGPLFNVYINR
jgi:hypothetical protein